MARQRRPRANETRMTAAIRREREPRRLAHRAAEQRRDRAASRWLSEEVDEALQIDRIAETAPVSAVDPVRDAVRKA